MTKLVALFWLGLVLASGFATFTVKYAVQGIDEQLRQTRKQIVAEEEQIRVLTAEWNYLNRPSRLADLNQRFLQLAPISANQLEQKIEDISFWAPAVTTTEFNALPLPAGGADDAGRPIAAADRSAAPAVAAAAYADDSAAATDGLPVRLAAAARTTGTAAMSAACPSPCLFPRLSHGGTQTPAPASLDALFAQVAEVK
jgi:hypothetical protein